MRDTRARLYFSLLLLATACSGGKSGGGSGFDEATPMLQPDGPLSAVVLATELSRDGSIAPRLTFTTADTQVTASVVLGSDVPEDATLTMAWFVASSPGEREHLFSHEIPVAPRVRVFSQGVASGGLAPGLYETVATLGEWEVRTPWIVDTAGAPARVSGIALGAASSFGLAQPAQAEPGLPAAGESGSDPLGVYGPPDVPEAGGEPPDTCDGYDVSNVADVPRVDAVVSWFGPCSTPTLTATVSGSPQTVPTFDTSGQPGPFAAHSVAGPLNVCDLPGGSDLPGTVVRYVATGAGGGSGNLEYTLEDLGPELAAGIETEPESGSSVEPGDIIKLEAMALVFDPALGVEGLRLYANEELFDSKGNASNSDEPIPCDYGRLASWIRESRYEVPQDPPPVIEICAEATGFDFTVSRRCAKFYTGEVWTGTLTGTGVNHPPGPCEPAATYDYTIEIVVGPGDVATLTGHGITGSSCDPTTSENDLALTGTRTENGFEFPAPEFPGPITITTVGSRGTGEGHGFIEAFEYNLSVDVERVDPPGT